MQSIDLGVITQAKDWLDEGKTIWFCTILNTYGSAPRPIGSVFATDGKLRAGSISGGCLEDAFLEMITNNEFNRTSQLFAYGQHSQSEAGQMELPCGGTIQLLVERIESHQDSKQHFKDWQQHARNQTPCKRTVTFDKGMSIEKVTAEACQEIEVQQDRVILKYQQTWNVLLLGISQVSAQVAQLAKQAGYQVRVCDVRESLFHTWQDESVPIENLYPSEFINKYANVNSAVLALAHDPRIDDIGLMDAFNTDAFYIGAMGSKLTSEKRRERLLRVGSVSEQQLQKLHAPIGLDIGSKTPVEIAIAIMAEIIAVRNRKV
jgi:xanthine dehydrogenase accessory factor